MDIAAYFKLLVERLSFSFVVAVTVSSGVVAFIPVFTSVLDRKYIFVALILFIFGAVWLLSESVSWFFKQKKERKRRLRIDRAALYQDISNVRGRLYRVRVSRVYDDDDYEIMVEIAGLYSRLRRLGVEAPVIDLDDQATWLPSKHIRFMTGIMPFLRKGPMGDLKRHARVITKKANLL